MKKTIETDVLIIGTGPAGIGATVGAIDSGAKTVVLEKLSYPGGRATASAVGTICGLYFRGQNARFAFNGFPKDFANYIIKISNTKEKRFSENLWFLPCSPSTFETSAYHFLNHSLVQCFFNSEITSVDINDKTINRIAFKIEDQEILIKTNSLVDCSGAGVSLDLIDHPTIKPEGKQQASAIVFCMEDITEKDETILNFSILKHIIENIHTNRIPEYYSLISLIPSSLKENSVQIKIGLNWNTQENSYDIKSKVEKLVHEVFCFLKSSVPTLINAKIKWIANEIGQRSGPRPLCKEVLTEADLLGCRKKNTSICNGTWPIEFWEIGNKKVNMTYFLENDHYSIPANCLISENFNNLFFAGKLISATERAIASARVIGTCLGTGYAAGVLAAYKSIGKDEADAIRFIQSKILNI